MMKRENTLDAKGIKAAFKNGTLSITVPKVDNREISRKKQIEIED